MSQDIFSHGHLECVLLNYAKTPHPTQELLIYIYGYFQTYTVASF